MEVRPFRNNREIFASIQESIYRMRRISSELNESAALTRVTIDHSKELIAKINQIIAGK